MSPIIDLQRRMVEAGRIRAGEKGGKGEPRKLDKWRLTSKDKSRLDYAAALWGGEVREWDGQWELYTERESLPIMVTPETQASLWYELWSAGGCKRRCDGVTEMLSDSPCLCDEDERECKPALRFSVLLPDVPGLGSWLVQSNGVNAAREIPGTLSVLTTLTAQGVMVPARLRLEQRSDVKNGQTRRYAVPVIDIDAPLRDLLGQRSQLPPASADLPQGYKPLSAPAGNGTTLEQGLLEANREPSSRTARSTAELPVVDDDIPFGTDPVPVEPEPSTPSGGSDLKPTKRMNEKLGVLIRVLRDERQVISTENLYAALAKMRNIDVDTMIDVIPESRDENGELHFGPLLKTLVRGEASDLIDRLERLEQNTETAA